MEMPVPKWWDKTPGGMFTHHSFKDIFKDLFYTTVIVGMIYLTIRGAIA